MNKPAWVDAMPPIVGGFLFYGSRKFGTGLWIIVLATYMVRAAALPLSDWKDLILVASLLIGGGTIADKYLQRPDASQNADRQPQ